MRDLGKIERIVIKIGTQTLTKLGTVEIDSAYIKEIARQISQIHQQSIKVIIVTSGAIGMGAGQLKMTEAVKNPQIRQVCAAVGQPLLMQEYKIAFSKYKITVAQILLTSHVLDREITYRNLQNALKGLIERNVLPIINENDSVSTEEIGKSFGDNDRLSARVASKIEADLLIILTDIEGLYTKDPRKYPDATLVPTVDEISPEIIASAGEPGSNYARGGMASKIEAVKIAFDAGCQTIIAHGREKNVLTKIIQGKDIGTIFKPKTKDKIDDRKRWIRNSFAAGRIKVNQIFKKVKKNQDIFPKDIMEVEGVFQKNSVIEINGVFKAVSQLDSDLLKELQGKPQSEVKKKLGNGYGSTIAVKHDDVVKI